MNDSDLSNFRRLAGDVMSEAANRLSPEALLALNDALHAGASLAAIAEGSTADVVVEIRWPNGEREELARLPAGPIPHAH